MAARVTRLAPAAAQEAPDQGTREQGLRALRLELEAQSDAGLAALLQHEIARLHERREDLASAARDELATTKRAAGFVEPIESLIDIATRSRSKANLAKLLERLTRLATSPDEKLRASLGLALTHLSNEAPEAAQLTVERALEESPTEPALWLALESIASETGDPVLLLKAATGRAAHAQSEEMRCLLLERVARLEVEVGSKEAAFAALRQSVDELPTWRALHAWEELGVRAGEYSEAGKAAVQTATILRAGLEEPEEAELYQIPSDELSEERAISAHVRGLIYAIRSGDDEEARGLAEQLAEASPHSALALSLLLQMCRKQGDVASLSAALERLREARKWSAHEGAILVALQALAAKESGDRQEEERAIEELRALAPQSLLPRIESWKRAEQADSITSFAELLEEWGASGAEGSGRTACLLALSLVQMFMGQPEAARKSLERAGEAGGPLGALLNYVAESLGESKGKPTLLPPGVGSEKDQAALRWEEVRSALSRTAEEGEAARTPESSSTRTGTPHASLVDQTDDPWANLLLRLLHSGLTPDADSATAAGVAEVESPGTLTEVASEESPSEDTETNSFEGTDRFEEADRFEDGVIAVLTQSSVPPGNVASPAETEEESPAEIVDESHQDDLDHTPGSPQSETAPPTSAPSSAPGSTTRQALRSYLSGGEGTAEFRRALQVLLVAGWGDFEQLEQQWESNPADPLLAAALLASLEAKGEAGLFVKRRKAAERQEGVLKQAWLLKAAADALAEGQPRRARECFEGSGAFAGDDELTRWFAAAEGPQDPQALAKIPSERDASLEQAALVRRFYPEEWSSLSFSSPTEAVQILQVLVSSMESLEAIEYAFDDTELFDESQRAALFVARPFSPSQNEELLEATKRWVRASPSAASLLTHWVAAVRARDTNAQAEVIETLATELEVPSLLAAVPAGHLPREARTEHRSRLSKQREQSEGTAEQSLSWAIFDQTEDEVSEEHAAELWRLSRSLDVGLEDPDAQAALLLTGYEYLTLGKFEEATQVFESLLEVLPGDLTLCHGARIAAARVGRPDLEAITSCELARATEDNRASAALWERAGVLFEDELDDRDEAEKCFTAALSRSPGSRVSFERVYRFARERNDRQRQVELIDARLDTADSESLQIELYWEKARFCRMLGRRTIALRALEELLKIAPDHLPALALSAELHLVDGRIDRAAEALRAVATHPDTPSAERGTAGLHACDLYEQLRRPRDAVELLQVLDEYGVSTSAGLERRARSLARSQDWGEAYKAFAELNGDQDDIEMRLESARMMLAIQRDHLKDPEELKRSARAVLRDAPLDADAIEMVLQQKFSPDERRRLLTPARGQSRELLRRNPLNPPEIERFAALCLDCGEDYMERIALGNLGLLGKLSEGHRARLDELRQACLPLPSQPLSHSDLEAVSDPLQLGSAGRYLALLAPYLSQELDPSLEALGFSSLMRTDEFSGSAHRAEIGTWMGCFGHNDFELYVGGSDPQMIRGVVGDLPTILVGKDVPVPHTPVDRARVVAQLVALHHGTVVFLNQAPEEVKKWIRASEVLAGGINAGESGGEIDELARVLSKLIPKEVRDELSHLQGELSRAGVDLSNGPYVVMRGAARAACLARGEAQILRELPELVPEPQELLNAAMADAVRFVLSNDFITIRRRIGLEGA